MFSSNFYVYCTFNSDFSLDQLNREFYENLQHTENSYLALKVITSIAETEPKFYKGSLYILSQLILFEKNHSAKFINCFY